MFKLLDGIIIGLIVFLTIITLVAITKGLWMIAFSGLLVIAFNLFALCFKK
jgi:hypothetical protein